MRGDSCCIDLEHFFFENKVFPPNLFDTCLDGASYGAKVIKTSTASIDLKALEEDISAFDQIIKQFFVLLHQLEIEDQVPFCL